MYTTDLANPHIVLTAGDYIVHQAANIVPLDTNFEPLENSIKRTGLIEPISLYQGEIIDGRRRAIVCKKLGIPVREDEIAYMDKKPEKEIYEFVLAKNNRRSLSKAQLSMIAAVEVSKNSHTLMGISRATDYAKQIWDVSKVTYEKARFILRTNRIIANEIFSTGFSTIKGERISMNKTYEILRNQNNLPLSINITGTGDQETALFYSALNSFLDTQLPHIGEEKVKEVLQQKLQELS